MDAFKKAEVWSLYKKDGRSEKSNYRSISVLLNVSKIYETSLYDQNYFCFDQIVLRYQWGFRKGINVQYILLAMVKKWKFCGTNIFVQLFWQTSQRHLTVYVRTYQEALKLIHSYLYDRSQKVKVGISFNKKIDILCRVPQELVLGLLLFTIDICDLFFIDMSSDIEYRTLNNRINKIDHIALRVVYQGKKVKL